MTCREFPVARWQTGLFGLFREMIDAIKTRIHFVRSKAPFVVNCVVPAYRFSVCRAGIARLVSDLSGVLFE